MPTRLENLKFSITHPNPTRLERMMFEVTTDLNNIKSNNESATTAYTPSTQGPTPTQKPTPPPTPAQKPTPTPTPKPSTPQKIEPYKLPKSLTLYSVADACVEWDDNIYARRSKGGYKSVKMCEMKRFYQLERIVEYITDNPNDMEKAKNMLNAIIHNPRKPQKKAKELNGKPGTTTTIKSGCWEWSVKFTHEGARFGKYPIKFK